MSRLENRTRNRILATHVEKAEGFFERMRGLLGRSDLPNQHALWISSCNSIHTWFMKFPIDVVFVDKNLCVKRIVKTLVPNRLIPPVWSASSVFELKGGSLADSDIVEGDQLYVGA